MGSIYLVTNNVNGNHQKMRMSKLGVPLSEAHKQPLRESWKDRDVTPVMTNLKKAIAESKKKKTFEGGK